MRIPLSSDIGAIAVIYTIRATVAWRFVVTQVATAAAVLDGRHTRARAQSAIFFFVFFFLFVQFVLPYSAVAV